MTELAIVFLVNIVSSALKRWVYPRWGSLGVQTTVFCAAIIGALYVTYGENFPTLQMLTVNTIAIFSLAVTFYEVILKYLPIFKKGTLE